MKRKTSKQDIKFSKRAAVYDEQFEGRLSKNVYQLVTENVKLKQGDKVLDVGCGTGTILKRLNDICNIEGFGIDMEEKMIEQAKKKCPQMNIQKNDCSNTPFADETFDSVIACMAFHHFYAQTTFAKEVSRILKKGGKCYIADPQFPLIFRKIINAVISKHNLVGKFNTPQETIEIFRPYSLIEKEIKKNGIFHLIVFEKL